MESRKSGRVEEFKSGRVQKEEVEGLAREMGTSEEGTSLEALAEVARKHGFHPRGLMLTSQGLERQKLPLIALVQPGHYIIVDQLAGDRVIAWDPDLRGIGQGGARTYPLVEWKRVWRGVVLTL